ncbi:MAG TPA: hypothetical protein VHZ76_06795 [Gammaproteobacteria bacterium]|nr:hypothetical protein [Gammaproteobacteria bacterium]
MLSIHEQYIVNEKGKKTAAILPYREWKKVVAILEEYEDIRAYDKVKSKPSNPVPFKKAVKKLK